MDHQAVARAFVGPAVARADEHGVSRPDHHVRETNRLILPSSVRSSPTKTVRVRPNPRPNLPDSSDESEGGLIEAFRERNARNEGLAVGAAVVGLNEGLAVGAAVVGLNEGLAVGAAVVGLNEGLAVGAAVVGLNEGLAVGGAVGAAVVGIDQGIDVGESVGFEAGEEEEDDEDEGEYQPGAY